MIITKNISKAYDDVQALKNISIHVKKGELCGLVGPNGAGKSTLFKILIGMLQPDEGELQVDNVPVQPGDFAYRQKIGYSPEAPALYDYLTGIEFLKFVASAKKINHKAQDTEINKWLSFFKLEAKADELVVNYSHGMRRKISLCAALVGSPKLLLLDEATNGLDPETSFSFKNHLRDYCADGGTVFFSSHIIETIENLCDRIIILNKGVVIREMERAEWQSLNKQGKSLEQVFIDMLG